MARFLQLFFFDWLSVTIPNSTNGKGKRSDGLFTGQRENDEAAKRLFMWSTLQGLRVMRIGKGTDGYFGGAHLAFEPTAKERVATIRDGHATNMPNIELTGANGLCDDLAKAALHELGPVLISRVDSSMDISQAGLWDELFELACDMAVSHKMEPPTVQGTEGQGRTFYFGKGEARLRVYEKSFEMLANEKIEEADLDPNLVRVEFIFSPKKEKKAGLAIIAAEQGPGALLNTTRWVRKFTEKLAVMTLRVREENAELAVGRVRGTPSVKRPQEMAKAAIKQYKRSLCNGAISQIVEDDFDGDWDAAVVDPQAVVEAICDWVRDGIADTAYDLCDDHGVMSVYSLEVQADRDKARLDDWMLEQNRKTHEAQLKLKIAADAALAACGVINA